MLGRILAHPLTKGLAPDDPRTTELRRRIIKEKAFLRKLYEEWYRKLITAIPAPDICPGQVLELGSGGGFLREMLPECISSEVFPCAGVDMTLDARQLPFADKSLRAIVMVDVFHHVPDVAAFLDEAQRALAPGGVIAMLEPWHTSWSNFIYRRLHSEPFVPETPGWTFPETGPLSGANGALPWIVFERDREKFAKNFPGLKLKNITLDYPFSYLFSGGVSLRALLPGVFFSAFRAFERMLKPMEGRLALFAFILLQREDLNN